MAQQVRVLIITGYGTNCEKECAHAAKLAGADSITTVHFADLAEGRTTLTEYNFLVFPGGFLDGDDLGAAQAAAQRWKYTTTKTGALLIDQLRAFIAQKGVIIGICNGFQLLVKLGLLPAFDNIYFTRQVSLAHNASARYEDRWCHLKVNPASPCVFTKGLSTLYLPVRHGEGNLVPEDAATLERLSTENLITLQYSTADGTPTEEYPLNPNGSPLGIAGLCDPTGRIFGLMPHPEAFNDITNHPGWTRGEKAPLGITLFTNAVTYLKQQTQ